MSLQNALNKLFHALGEVFRGPSASAYCQAKKKVKPEVFAHLSEVLCKDFYTLYGADQEVRLWHGHRLIGADGTYLTLPDTKELRASFSVHPNQHVQEQHKQVQALALVLHDLLNDLGVASAIGPAHLSERSLLFDLWSATAEGDCLVLDRNSAHYTIIAKAKKEGREVIIRCPRQSFSVVNEFWGSKDRERIVMLRVSQRAGTRKYVKENNLPEEVTVRLVKFRLASGEEEVLLTTCVTSRSTSEERFLKSMGGGGGMRLTTTA